jgi:tRNA(Ile)-lysidine synthase
MITQTFIVAVSGGVDSVVLLHMLVSKKRDNLKYVVAHFDHGIRSNSKEDAEFVKLIAKDSQLDFELGTGNLGPDASEETARNARYAFLRRVKDTYRAEKIVTAHHQDDLVETMVMNIMRGTSPRGLSPMQGFDDILRPLMNKTKSELIVYAKKHDLEWREDGTNDDTNYTRNLIRQTIIPKIGTARKELLAINRKVSDLYRDIDIRIVHLLPKKNVLSRSWFSQLPYVVQKELMRTWLVRSGVIDLDATTIVRVVNAVKTLPIGKRTDVNGHLWLISEKQNVLLTSK